MLLAAVAWVASPPEDDKLELGASGSVAEFVIEPDGKITHCHEAAFGDKVFGPAEQCQAFDGGDAKGFDQLLGRPQGRLTHGAMRLYIAPASDSAGVPLIPAGAHSVQLAAATFDVLPTGRVANCRQDVSLAGAGLRNICAEVLSPETRFRQPLSGQTVRMRLIADLWVN